MGPWVSSICVIQLSVLSGFCLPWKQQQCDELPYWQVEHFVDTETDRESQISQYQTHNLVLWKVYIFQIQQWNYKQPRLRFAAWGTVIFQDGSQMSCYLHGDRTSHVRWQGEILSLVPPRLLSPIIALFWPGVTLLLTNKDMDGVLLRLGVSSSHLECLCFWWHRDVFHRECDIKDQPQCDCCIVVDWMISILPQGRYSSAFLTFAAQYQGVFVIFSCTEMMTAYLFLDARLTLLYRGTYRESRGMNVHVQSMFSNWCQKQQKTKHLERAREWEIAWEVLQ